MRKIVIFFILITLVLLVSCSKESENLNTLYDINYQTNSDDSLEFKTEKQIYTKDDKVIKYTIKNIGDTENTINSDEYCFDLHILKDGEWKRVGTKIDHYWTEVALILQPNQVENREINLEEYYHLPLSEGTYRICIENILSDTFEIKH